MNKLNNLSDEEFDKLFRQSAEEMPIEFEESAWQNMENLLNKKQPETKPKAYRKYTALLLALLFLGSIATYFVLKNTTNPTNNIVINDNNLGGQLGKPAITDDKVKNNGITEREKTKNININKEESLSGASIEPSTDKNKTNANKNQTTTLENGLESKLEANTNKLEKEQSKSFNKDLSKKANSKNDVIILKDKEIIKEKDNGISTGNLSAANKNYNINKNSNSKKNKLSSQNTNLDKAEASNLSNINETNTAKLKNKKVEKNSKKLTTTEEGLINVNGFSNIVVGKSKKKAKAESLNSLTKNIGNEANKTEHSKGIIKKDKNTGEGAFDGNYNQAISVKNRESVDNELVISNNELSALEKETVEIQKIKLASISPKNKYYYFNPKFFVEINPMDIPLPAQKPDIFFKKGLSIRAAISPDISKVGGNEFHKIGSNFGGYLEYRFGKRLSAQAGIFRSVKYYDAYPEQYNWVWGKPASKLVEIEAICKMIDYPVNIRYDIVANPKTRLFLSTGLTSYKMMKETYNYDYEDNLNPNIRWRQWNGKTGTYITSNLNISAGFEKQISKKFTVQVEPFVKSPLKSIGFGKVPLITYGMMFSASYPLFKY